MKYQVIISGAGPVGCWLAGELRLAGISTLVLEQTETISPQSRALTIHPRTIELFASRGIEKKFLDEGVEIPSGHFALLDYRLNFRPLESAFPFTLAIPQARITELLQQRARELGADIRRGHKVSGYSETPASVAVTIESPTGAYQAEADYLVGCDGVRSTVRTCAGVNFPGTDCTVGGWLGDVILESPPDNPMVHEWTLNGTMAVARMPGGLHRLVGISPDDVSTERRGELTLEELRAKTIAIMGTDYGMHTPSWLSRYDNTCRQAETYRKGRVLLAGDAAHRHMPAGGVGLNVGIQDAMNLGWKLAATINGWAPDGLLDTYHDERHPVGKDLLEHTQAQTALMSAFSNEGKELRSLLNKLVIENSDLELSLARRLTGLSVVYPANDTDAHHFVGHRAPDLAFADAGEGLFAKLRDGRYALFDLRATTGSQPIGTEDFSGLANPRVNIHRGPLGGTAPAAWTKLTAFLVRPDGHVAWASEETNTPALKAEVHKALQRAFAPTAGLRAEAASAAA